MLKHDFYEADYLPEDDRLRYTICPEARRELLGRLLALNHLRAEAEKAAGGTNKPKRGKKAQAPPTITSRCLRKRTEDGRVSSS